LSSAEAVELPPDLGLGPRISIPSAEPEFIGALGYCVRSGARSQFGDHLGEAMFVSSGARAIAMSAQYVMYGNQGYWAPPSCQCSFFSKNRGDLTWDQTTAVEGEDSLLQRERPK
jgi:hypothetical protein